MSSESSAPALDAVAFGARIAERRRSLGIPQDQLAHAVGISRVQLQNIEQGLSDRAKRTPANPRMSTLMALCGALQLTVTLDLSFPSGFRVEWDSAADGD